MATTPTPTIINETIKSTIDTNITNKTTDNSITPTILGNTLKTTVDNLRPFKIYRALLFQSGTDAPVVTVIENTLGGTLVWSYNDVGSYTATLTGAFILGKTAIKTPGNQLNLSSTSDFEIFSSGLNNSDSIYLMSGYINMVNGITANNNVLFNKYIEIITWE